MVNYLPNQEFVKLVSELWLDTFNTIKIKQSFEFSGICPLNPKIVYEKMDKKLKTKIYISENQNDVQHFPEICQKKKENNKNDPVTHIKINIINNEVLKEIDALKKQVVTLQSQLFQMKSETVIKKRKKYKP